MDFELESATPSLSGVSGLELHAYLSRGKASQKTLKTAHLSLNASAVASPHVRVISLLDSEDEGEGVSSQAGLTPTCKISVQTKACRSSCSVSFTSQKSVILSRTFYVFSFI